MADESRAAEAATARPANMARDVALPGTASRPGEPDADALMQAQARKLRKLRTASSATHFSAAADDGTPTSKSKARWGKLRTAVSVQTSMANQLVEMRAANEFLAGESGRGGEHGATIEETEARLEAERHASRGKWYVILPENNFKMGWDLAQVVVLLYVATVVPLRIGFDAEASFLSAGWWVELFVDIYFLLDVSPCRSLALSLRRS